MTLVVKANGDTEEFSEEKLLESIKRAGIPQKLYQLVINHVKERLHERISTADIYHHVLEFLDTIHPYSKSTYSLKQSIMQLGPTGYPFEKFLAHLFEREGYNTLTNQLIHGTCVTHEIDVVAENSQNKIMVEAKFHNTSGIKTDLHVSLYTKARFDDIAKMHNFTKAMLVTNTKASVDAIAYAQCVGIEIITWGYPQGKGLQDLIEKYHLHPITSLHSLSQNQKQQLFDQDIVLCRDLLSHQDQLSNLHLSPNQQKYLLEETSFVCSHQSES